LTPKLPLPDETPTLLFRAIAEVISTDPVVRSVVKTLKLWDDSTSDRTPISGPGVCPAVELYPSGGPENYATPDTMEATLFVDCCVTVAGLRVDNATNLWFAIVRALRPRNNPAAAMAIAVKLKTAGATTGIVLISRPGYVPKPDGANAATMEAFGQIAVRYMNK
jgi:hypothetical protein